MIEDKIDNSVNTFNDALKVLNIEDYAQRIFNSNSNGELFHLQQYFMLAEHLKDNSFWFREWFENVVKFAEQNWQRPESVFQHISKILVETYNSEK